MLEIRVSSFCGGALVVGLSSVLLVACSTPSVVRPSMGDRPISVIPPTPGEGGDGQPSSQLSHVEQVKVLLDETDQPVRIRVFARPLEGDPMTQELERVCRNILALSRTPTRFDLHDPVATEEAANEARNLGVVPLGATPGNRRRRDPLPQDAEYRALVVAVGREVLTVPQITADRGDLEFQVAEAISRLIHGPRRVGLMTSATLEVKLSKLRKTLDRLELTRVSLDVPLSRKLATVMVIGPGEKLKRPEVDELRRFLDLGKSALLLIDGMEVEPAQKRYRVRRVTSGLDDFLDDYGLAINHDLVFDNHCGRVSVPARVGRMLVAYPPIPAVNIDGLEFAPHARELRLPYPSSLEISPRKGIEVTTILASSTSSWPVERGFNLSPHQEWNMSKRGGPYPFGVIAVKEGASKSKLVVIANSRFVQDQYIGVTDNDIFLRQLVEWLGGHSALVRMVGN